MADKARKTFVLPVKLIDGEKPSAGKFNAVATQARNGQDILERLIGDPWNQGGDLILSPSAEPNRNALYIPNLARMMGSAWLMNSTKGNPESLTGSAWVFTDNIGSANAGSTRAALSLSYVSGTPTLSGSLGSILQANFISSAATDVDSTGDWGIFDNVLHTFDPIPSGLIITYIADFNSDTNLETDSTNGGTGTPKTAGLWNVIPTKVPGEISATYDGVKISFANGTDNALGYHIWLPPKMYWQFTGIPNASNNVTSGNPDSVTPFKLFQSSAQNASLTNAAHYRYLFPEEVAPGIGYTGLAAGSRLPDGFLYIWDEDRATIIEGVSFYTPATTTHSRFKVRAVGTNLATVFGTTIGSIVTSDATQLPGDYKERFKIITIGNPMAAVLSHVRDLLHSHRHDGSSGTDRTQTISHGKLTDLVTPPYSADNPNYPTTAPSYTETNWLNDHHPQYLHRAGNDSRDSYLNAVYQTLSISDQTSPTDSSYSKGTLSAVSGTVKLASFDSILRLEAGTLGLFGTLLYMDSSTGAQDVRLQAAAASGKLSLTTNSAILSSVGNASTKPRLTLDGSATASATLALSTAYYTTYRDSDKWFGVIHSGLGANYFDTDLVLSSAGRFYFGGSMGTLGTAHLSHASSRFLFTEAGQVRDSAVGAGNHLVVRTSGTYAANNFKYVDNLYAASHSALQYYTVSCSEFAETDGTSFLTLVSPSWPSPPANPGTVSGDVLKNTATNSPKALAPVNLPNGAQIVGIAAKLADGQYIGLPTQVHVALWSTHPVTGTSSIIDSSLIVSSAGTGAYTLTTYSEPSPSFTESSTVLVSVNNDLNSYFLYASYGFGSGLPTQLQWVKIYYVMPELAW